MNVKIKALNCDHILNDAVHYMSMCDPDPVKSLSQLLPWLRWSVFVARCTVTYINEDYGQTRTCGRCST